MSIRAMYIPEVKCILLLENANYHLSLLEKLVLTHLLSAGLPQSSNLLKKKKSIKRSTKKGGMPEYLDKSLSLRSFAACSLMLSNQVH